MKKGLFILALGIVGTQPLLAAETERPLLTKSRTSGLTPEWATTYYSCEVHADKVVIQTRSGGLVSSREIPILLQGNVEALIAQAAQGAIIQEDAPTDGPITSWNAVQPDLSVVALKAEGSARLRNESRAAQTLINFIDQNCR